MSVEEGVGCDGGLREGDWGDEWTGGWQWIVMRRLRVRPQVGGRAAAGDAGPRRGPAYGQGRWLSGFWSQ